MIKITPQQAYDIINSTNTRIVKDLRTDLEVFFSEDMDDKEALFSYDPSDDNSLVVAYKSKMDECEWTLDKDYIEASVGDEVVFQGKILIKPTRDEDSLVG